MVAEASTLTALLKSAAEENPSRRALSVVGRMHLTHRRLDELVDEAAGILVAAGVKRGDVVALTFPNTPEFVIAFLAVIRARATAAPLNPAYTADEFTFYLSDSDSKLLLTSNSGHPAAESAAAKLSIPTATVSLDSSPAATLSISFETDNSSEHAVAEITNVPSDVALFLHTSGTTSRPKGVPLTQLNLAASVTNIKSAYHLVAGDSTLHVLPLFHVHGLLAGLLAPLAAASAVALPAAARFSASSFWPDMLAVSATWFTAVPTIHQILLDRHSATAAGENSGRPVYPKLRFIRSCSASLAPAVMERMEAAFGAPVVEAYAMTEAAHLMATNPLPQDGPRRAGSVGRTVGQEMAVLDEDGVLLPVGKSGEVCIRGPNVTSGYKGNPEANRAAFRFGWFHTGDTGYLDSDGYLHLVGRIKELINRGGEKISPIEVDAVLLSHPDLAEAVAFGVPDDKYGEEVNCAVIPKAGVVVSEAEVMSYCRKNLAAIKVPKRVFVADSLPKTATGKIQRRIVAEHFLAKVSAAKVPKFGA